MSPRRTVLRLPWVLPCLVGAGAAFVALAPHSDPRLSPAGGPHPPSPPTHVSSAAPAPGLDEEGKPDLSARFARLARDPRGPPAVREWLHAVAPEDAAARLRSLAREAADRDAQALARVLLVAEAGDPATGDLVEILGAEGDSGLRRCCVLSLAAGGDRSVRELRSLLEGTDDDLAAVAACALCLMNTAEAHGALLHGLAAAAANPLRRRAIHDALAGRRPSGYPFSLPFFRTLLAGSGPLRPDPMCPGPWRELLARTAREPDPGLRLPAARGLAALPGPEADRLLGEMWRDSRGEERAGIRRILLGRPGPGAMEALVENAPLVPDRPEREAALEIVEGRATPALAEGLGKWEQAEPDAELRRRLRDLRLGLRPDDPPGAVR